jgi:hypothetical protein
MRPEFCKSAKSTRNLASVLCLIMTAASNPAQSPSPCQTSQTTINDPATIAWTNKLVSALGTVSACQLQRSDDDQGAITVNTACNIFVGTVIDNLYGVKDFYVSPPQTGKSFYLANEIGVLLQTGVWPNWTDLGTADNQGVLNNAKSAADSGGLVIAVWVNPDAASQGHIALIGPGPLTHSSKWNEDMPVAASLSLRNPGAGFLGKPLSCAFGSNKAAAVHLWSRQS